MENIIDSSYKVNNSSDSTKTTSTISGDSAVKMLLECKIKPETVQISDKGIVTFQDKNGDSFRAELSKDQINIFQKDTNLQADKTGQIPPEMLNIGTNTPAGSAQSFIGIFDDSHGREPANEPVLKNKKDDNWTFRFNFGYNRTKYFDTDMHLKSSRMDVNIKDFSFQERTSSDFYNPGNWQSAQDAFRWIDEPTNSFILSAEKNNNVFSISAFHPKFLKQNYETKHVTGTVDGVTVDKMMPINEPFDGYNDKLGEMHLTRFESTHRQMDWQFGYGRNITLMNNDKYGKLLYTPSIYAGVTSGQHVDVYAKPNEYWEFNDYEDKHRIQGLNASFGNRLQYEYGKASVFVENKTTVSHLKHQFMDGTAEYNMKYNATTFGLGFKLYETKPKPEKPEL